MRNWRSCKFRRTACQTKRRRTPHHCRRSRRNVVVEGHPSRTRSACEIASGPTRSLATPPATRQFSTTSSGDVGAKCAARCALLRRLGSGSSVATLYSPLCSSLHSVLHFCCLRVYVECVLYIYIYVLLFFCLRRIAPWSTALETTWIHCFLFNLLLPFFFYNAAVLCLFVLISNNSRQERVPVRATMAPTTTITGKKKKVKKRKESVCVVLSTFVAAKDRNTTGAVTANSCFLLACAVVHSY